MEGYIRDGIAPLRRYLSTGSTATTLSTSKQNQSLSTFWDSAENDGNQKIGENSDPYGDIMDWGIESMDEIDGSNTVTSHNDHDMSSPTLINEFNYSNIGNAHMGYDHELDGATPHADDKFYDWGISPKKSSNNKKYKLRGIFHELMRLNHEQHMKNLAFLDEFRYIVITSQLLDQTILVSKFQQRKKQSLLNLMKYNQNFYKNGLLISMNQNITIRSFLQPFNVINIIILLTYFQKNRSRFQISQIRLVLIISLIVLNAHTKSHIQQLDLIQNKTLNQVKKFIKLQQNFDIQAQKLVTKYKELKLYNNILPIQKEQNFNDDPSNIFDLVSSTLIVASTSIINSIHKILPYVNGCELENYCELYNIELTQLVSEMENLKSFNISENESTIDQAVQKFRRFQYLRRFLIVLFLAMNHQFSTHSPFLMKIFGIFQIKSKLTCSTLESSILVSKSLESLQGLISGLIEALLQSSITSNNKVDFIKPNSPSVDQLMKEIKNFEVQLMMLRRDQSPQQLREVGQTLDSLQQLYRREVKQLQTPKQRSVSTPSSLLIEKRQRFSLPNASNYSHSNIQQPPQTPRFSKNSSHKHYKRLSTGLALPLLTVTEEEESSKRAVSYDDNYLNIMPVHSPSIAAQNQNQNTSSPAQNHNRSNSTADYIEENNLLSNDDSVLFTSHDNNETEQAEEEEKIDGEEFKKRLELNFSKMINGNSNGSHEEKDDQGELDNEVNLNDEKIDTKQGAILMDELKLAFNNN